MRPTTQRVLDERGHVAAWAGLDEQPRTVVVERLDGLAEADGARPVLHEQLADLLRVLRGRPGSRAGEQLGGGGAAPEPAEDRAQVVGERGEQRRVDRSVVRKLLADHALGRRKLARA